MPTEREHIAALTSGSVGTLTCLHVNHSQVHSYTLVGLSSLMTALTGAGGGARFDSGRAANSQPSYVLLTYLFTCYHKMMINWSVHGCGGRGELT